MYPSRKSSIIFLIALLIVSLTHNTVKADFYVIAGGGKKVGKEITALPCTITQSGFYYIAKDLHGGTTDHGISIDTSNVTIDLMGFSLVGPGSDTTDYHGVYSGHSTASNIEVRNGTICDFGQHGYYMPLGSQEGHRVFNIRAINNGGKGIHISGDAPIIEQCTVINNDSDGITCGDGGVIKSNVCYDNEGSGIVAFTGCTVINNSCRNNSSHGILASFASNVIGNTCKNNTDHGIYLSGNSYVGQNTCYNNGTNINACPQSNPCSKGLNYAP